jgi:hypothetical protein
MVTARVPDPILSGKSVELVGFAPLQAERERPTTSKSEIVKRRVFRTANTSISAEGGGSLASAYRALPPRADRSD